MDPLTHGLIGAAIGGAFFPNLPLRKAVWVGALASMAPDLDIFIRSKDDPSIFLIYHRHFTHALSMAPVGGIIGGLLGILIFKPPRSKWTSFFLLSFLAFLSHGLIDSATSYGTVLWWPFSNMRVSWDTISIIDPIFSVILLVGIVISYIKKRPAASRIALSIALLYLTFGFAQHECALHAQRMLAESRNQLIIKGRVIPQLGQLFNFTSLYISDDKIYRDNIKCGLFNRVKIEQGSHFPHFVASNLPSYVKNNPLLINDFMVFNWFSDGFITPLTLQPLTLTDLRFSRELHKINDTWAVKFPIDAGNKHMSWLSLNPDPQSLH